MDVNNEIQTAATDLCVHSERSGTQEHILESVLN